MTEESNKPFDPVIFVFDPNFGNLGINTNNINYAGYVFKVTLTAEFEDVDNSELEYIFYVTINNGCESLTVIPPQALDDTPFNFNLWV